ncbi:hypothetical protein [Streptomyces paludis]|uniref:Uncharacterized protein n=1 Tax=Streptomyces paludis TaxID=2282738 RepID=A0A345HL18_9ACTN|nr:hypothetical protein [Streptomyces paludis]AXG77392.1 hypothetical protein DVK44_06455 [Streptomyces paludis]
MGWTVLYIAFGIVALWLLGEVLLQYKARLRWRVLAFGGFMVVVLGVLIPNVIVIGIGTAGFAVGQTYVTLSFRSGFATGWSIGGRPSAGSSRRRKAADREPALEVSDLEYEPVAPAADPAFVYATEPLPDETAQYGMYDDKTGAAAQGAGGQDADGQRVNDWTADFDAYRTGLSDQSGQPDQSDQDVFAVRAQDTSSSYGGGYGYQGQDGYAQQYDYGTGIGGGTGGDVGASGQQYAAYSDPYIGSSHASPPGDAGSYTSYDGFGNQQQYTDPYTGQQYAGDTPPGGVWMPQQRENDGDQPFPPVPGEPPYQQGYGTDSGTQPHYNDQQYRY